MKQLIFIILCFPVLLSAQKEIYIPNEWQQPNGLDYSFDRFAQSGNFIIFWGPLAGSDPTQAPSDIAFDPQFVLNTAEDLYKFYIDTIQFVNDDEGLLHQYKIILVMLHTWPGVEGWAFGGNYDGTVGAMWMHPHAASSGPTLAHEFTHTLQNYAWMLNPGHGFIDSSYVGFFWETHAEFMALQKYPSVALEFDMARWLNTCQFHWSSTRHHYQAFVFLQYIKELDGISMINRMWNEANIGEHPLETYKRLKGITQEALNDLFGDYAMHNVNWDYSIGDLLRERVTTLDPKFVAHPTFIPEAVDTSRGWYRIPNHLAPQDYGYNIIRLYPKELEGCDKRIVQINLKGQDIFPDYEVAGWRFGIVAVDENHQTRFSPLYHSGDEVIFELEADEEQVYLVVTGAPVEHHNYAWEIGFPKIYRYPYEFRIENAWPEGYQPGYRKVESGIAGAPHINGGGFVASTAFVEASAYVGPDAQVIDQVQVLGDARIEGYAIVKNNAVIEDSVRIFGNAIVGEDAHVYGHAQVEQDARVFGGCSLYDSAIVKGNSLIFLTDVYDQATLDDNTFCWGANLHGDIKLGGDAEFFSECSNGTYYQVEWAYDRNCDGMDYHPANNNITNSYNPAYIRNQYKLVCDTLLENVYLDTFVTICERDTFSFYNRQLYSTGIYDEVFLSSNGADSVVSLHLEVDPLIPAYWIEYLCEGDTAYIYGQAFAAPGYYEVVIENGGCGTLLLVTLQVEQFGIAVYLFGNTLYSVSFQNQLQWYDCGTGLPVPGATSNEFTPSTPGAYRLKATSVFGCEVFSSCYEVSTVSTKTPELNFPWHIQPNPAHESLQIILDTQEHSDLIIGIYDMTGNCQIKKVLENSKQDETINLEKLPSGSYLIRLSGQQGDFSSKYFIKI